MKNSATHSTQDRETALFALAVEKPASERSTFLQAVCGDDVLLRQRLEALLAAHDEPETVLTSDPGPPLSAPKFEVPDAFHDAVGQTLGRYKLLERIGEGGCGVVYVAEQTEPVRRRVALKVIKLGMDTKQVVARFEAERQALAMMDHPNIAKVLDAGCTESGRPYFVMELVRGIRITDYCDQSNLCTKDRLELFIKVCQAIQHAHQKGIIHRDIKPSNILVTLHDGVPVPKVIDFGIAKATEGRLTDATVYTQLHQFIGTPAYMSPEQAEMSGLDIDTRSDIYSLGVLLYELLAGCTPFDAQELMAAGIDEMRRTIREREPVPPSTRLATFNREKQTTTTKSRSTDISRLAHQLAGDLDWIVLKCLEKDRTRRYETANGIASDLQRHLENEPVLARPPSAGYRLQKAFRRNKLAFAAGSAVALSLIVGFGASLWQAVRATRAERRIAAERDAKEIARREAEAISTFLSEVFQSPDPSRDGRTITVAEILDRAARNLEIDLANQPERRAKLQATLGATYTTLGLPREATALMEKAYNYHIANSGPEAEDTIAAMHNLATSYAIAGRSEEAVKLFAETVRLCRKVLGPEHPNTLRAINNFANASANNGHSDKLFKLREETFSIQRRLNGLEHPDTLRAMAGLAESYTRVGRLDEALKLWEEAVPLHRKVNGAEHPDTLAAMSCLANAYSEAGRKVESLKLNEDTLKLERKVNGPEHPHTLVTMNNLASTYRDLGRHDEAGQLYETALRLNLKVNGPEHPNTTLVMKNLAIFYGDSGRHDEALKLFESFFLASLPKEAQSLPRYEICSQVGFMLDSIGRGEDAIRAWQEAVRLAPNQTDNVHYWLGKALVDRGRFVEALPILRATQRFYPDGERGRETLARIALAEAGGDTRQATARGQPRILSRPDLEKWLTALRDGVAADPTDTEKAKQLATVTVWLGLTNEHHAVGRALLNHAASSSQTFAHDRAAKACLINARLDPGTLTRAVDSGRKALKLARAGDPNRGWFLITAAMAELRAGEPAESERLANEALAMADPNKERRGLALAYRALARIRLNRLDEARADLAELEATTPSFPPPPAPSAILSSPDSMATSLARLEALEWLRPTPARKP